MESFIGIFVLLLFGVPLLLWLRLESRFNKIIESLELLDYRQRKLKKLLENMQNKETAEPRQEKHPEPTIDESKPEEKPTEAVVPVVQAEEVHEPVVKIPVTQIAEEHAETTEELAPVKEELQEKAVLQSIETPTEAEPAIAEKPEKPAYSEPLYEKETRNFNYEKFIGENLFGKIGILVFIIGIGFFVKYAIDKNWINEVARTVLGFATGCGMLILAERLHKRYRAFSSLLAGGAFGVFYLTVAIAFHYYHLFSQTSAFVTLICITLFMSGVSILYDRSELAVTALVGGFIAPFIISTGTSDIVTLYTYISILNLGMFALAMYKKWGGLPVIAFAFTYIIIGLTVLNDGTANPTPSLPAQMTCFTTLFFLIFQLPVFYILKSESTPRMNKWLMCVIVGNSFLYFLFGNFFVHGLLFDFEAEALVNLFIAAVNLALYLYLRIKPNVYAPLNSALLALTITFISITPPVLFRGSTFLIIWAAESVVLLWLYIKAKSRVYEVGAMVMAALTLLYYFTSGTYEYGSAEGTTVPLFLNADFSTSIFVSLAILAFAVLMHCFKNTFTEQSRFLVYTPYNAIMFGAGIFIAINAFINEFGARLNGDTAIAADFLATSTIFAASTVALRNRFKLADFKEWYVVMGGFITLLYMYCIWLFPEKREYMSTFLLWLTTAVIVFNLWYIIRGFLKIDWYRNELYAYFSVLATLVWVSAAKFLLLSLGSYSFSAGFSLSLGTAAFILMCLGMRIHSKPIRIVSLAEFGIVLAKLVLIDVWTMQAVGKIIVFISLGVILLTLSFLYQKLKNVLFGEEPEEKEE
ncbi:DUF2339 domain-containing protein [Hoylesella oralis]|uniref:DUF2339 domain-containing protein n=1 Tax=Hoylesella oralis TaxID=28134 RepID=UPI0028E83628|nr:DUF2339 domain-containing protein [Hoylesella oralis]